MLFTKRPVVAAVLAALAVHETEAHPGQVLTRAEHRDLILPPLCGIFVDGLSANLDVAITTLKNRKGWFNAQFGPGGCTKLACGDVVPDEADPRSAAIVASSEDCIWFCNDRTRSQALGVVERHDVVADIAETLKTACQGQDGAPTSGQVFGKEGWWNVIIGHSSSIPMSVAYIG